MYFFKGAKRSFRACSCQKKKKNWRRYRERSFSLLNARTICAIFLQIERSLFMTPVFYLKGKLENFKVTL